MLNCPCMLDWVAVSAATLRAFFRVLIATSPS